QCLLAGRPIRQVERGAGERPHGPVVEEGRAVRLHHPHLVRHGIEGLPQTIVARLEEAFRPHCGSPPSSNAIPRRTARTIASAGMPDHPSVAPRSLDWAERSSGAILATLGTADAGGGLHSPRTHARDQPRLPPSTLRATTTRMISLVPSRIWWTRRSRTSFSRP